MLKRIYLIIFGLLGFSLMIYGYSNPINLGKIYRVLNGSDEILFETTDDKKLTYLNTLSKSSKYNYNDCVQMQKVLVPIQRVLYKYIQPEVSFEYAIKNSQLSDFHKYYINENFKHEQCFDSTNKKNRDCLMFKPNQKMYAIHKMGVDFHDRNLENDVLSYGFCRSDLNILSSIYFEMVRGVEPENVSPKLLNGFDFFVNEDNKIIDFYIPSLDDLVDESRKTIH